jgi:hypothetical protein
MTEIKPFRIDMPHADLDDLQAGGQAGVPPAGGAPMGVAVFATDNSIRSLVDPAGAVAHWSEFDREGLVPALEVPDLLAGDLRRFLRAYR